MEEAYVGALQYDVIIADVHFGGPEHCRKAFQRI
jgi:hypothetical protein